jgi:Rad3-related DNA helicase
MALLATLFVNMKRVFAVDDKSLIRALRVEKGWGALRMMKEFPSRQWKQRTLNDLLKKIDATGNTERKLGSGRRRSTRTADNIAAVNELICSQEDQPGTSKSPREISREIGISRSSVQRIVKLDLKLKTFRRREVQLLSNADKVKRLAACKRLRFLVIRLRRMTRKN